MNGETNGLYAKGILSGNEEAEARKNLEMLSRPVSRKYYSESNSESESEDYTIYNGRLSPHPIKSVQHWNQKQSNSNIYVAPHL